MLIFALAYWGRNFSFVFRENWKNQKALSKLTDLYFLSILGAHKFLLQVLVVFFSKIFVKEKLMILICSIIFNSAQFCPILFSSA